MCFTYLQDGEAARAVVLRALKAGIPRRNVLAVRADVADEAAMELAFDAAESLGRVEVLVNNARLAGHDRRSATTKGIQDDVPLVPGSLDDPSEQRERLLRREQLLDRRHAPDVPNIVHAHAFRLLLACRGGHTVTLLVVPGGDLCGAERL